MKINGYEILRPGNWRAMGGNGECNYATKDGQCFFLKRMDRLKYPLDDSDGWTEEEKIEVRTQCEDWLHQHQKLSALLPGSGIGTLVKPVEYFRHEIYLYEAAHEVQIDKSITYKDVYKLQLKDKVLLMMTIAKTLAEVHAAGIVHADINPDNILLSRSESGNLVARLIDFTDSFESKNPPPQIMSKEYWCSPEIWQYVEYPDKLREYITGKSDVFSLGIVFHQYCAPNGEGPNLRNDYACLDVLQSRIPQIHTRIDTRVQRLIADMLMLEPDNRPSMEEVYKRLFVLYCGKAPSSKGFTGEINIVVGNGQTKTGLTVTSAALVQTLPPKVKIVFSDGSYQTMDLSLAEKCGYVIVKE